MKNYCLFGYPDYPDGTFRASPTSYSYLLRTFMNFGTAPPGSLSPMVLKRETAAMMRNVSEGAGSAPGQGDNPQGLIWYYDRAWGRHNPQLLGHNGGDNGISTDAYFNPKTGVGFIVYTNGDDEVSNREGKAYDDAQQAVETMIMSTFDVNGGWETPDQVAASSLLGRVDDVAAQQRRGRKRERAQKMPCGLPNDI